MFSPAAPVGIAELKNAIGLSFIFKKANFLMQNTLKTSFFVPAAPFTTPQANIFI